MISVTVRPDAVIVAGMFDESLRSSEDFDLWLRLLYQGSRFAYHHLPLVRYRRRRDSVSANPVWMCQSILKVLHTAECTMNLTLMEHAAINRQKLYFRALQELYEGKNAFLSRENPQRQLKGLREQTNSFRAVNYGGRAFFTHFPSVAQTSL
jgi:hypothetical protein